MNTNENIVVIMSSKLHNVVITPETLTIITTYTCNAACEECCFECNPSVKHRLSLEDMKNFINESKIRYPTLEIVVFSGGECFLLQNDLYEAIKYSTQLGLTTRCVTNGFWGRNKKNQMI